jgi:putative PIN family toxin of toxin-antitoxin system
MPFATQDGAGVPVRIVLDTNVVLSALLWRGTPYHLFEAIRETEPIEIFTSLVLLEELTEILLPPILAKRLALTGQSVRQVFAKYVETVDLVAPITTPRVVMNDIDDGRPRHRGSRCR